MSNLFDTVFKLLKEDNRFVAEDGSFLRNAAYEATMKMDEKLLHMLLNNTETKKHFFKDVDGITVFDKVEFGWLLNNKEFMPDSYTRFKNKIGLAVKGTDKLLSSQNDVELLFPYKDCVLEGGQTKEDWKKDEIFYNELLTPDEIDRILTPKVLVCGKKISGKGEEEITALSKKDNLIIKGNNLLALSSIKKVYSNSVKCIFVDPPYYFIENKPSDTFSYNSNFKLSSWLVFLKNRFQLAHELLEKTGTMFVAMSDEGVHYLKVLMDSIFGMDNFIADVTWESRKSVSSDGLMSMNSNHILVYAKNKKIINKNSFRLALDAETFCNDDKDGKGTYRLEPFDAPGIRKNLSYEIKNPNTGEIYTPPKGRCWRTEENNYLKLLDEGKIRFGVNGKAKPQLKTYYDEAKAIGKGKVASTIFHDVKQSIIWQEIDANTNATKDQVELFGESVFTNPKPEELIKRIIELSTEANDIVLDFFMGSATTQAVALKMNRQFIGVEQMEYIKTVSLERLKKVIAGEKTGISEEVNWQGGGSFVYCELAKLNQKEVEAIEAAQDTEALLTIWERMKETGFISCKVKPSDIDENIQDFKELSLDNQKRFLMEVLDKNLLYVNYADMDDAEFGISDADKAFTRSFYGEE